MPQFSSPPRAAVTEAMSLIEQRTGLAASTRLRLDLDRMLQQIAGGDVSALLKVLRQADISAPEWQMLISTLTIGETYFMRDARHFELLKSDILPQITLEKRRQHQFRLRIWCAGCSTGEEPYSLAITLHEFLPDIARWNIQLVGTDINHQAIRAARKGLYRDWSFRHTGPFFRRRYFDAVDDAWQIKAYLQKMVMFEQGTIPGRAPMEDCDIIFCRNMMLYLSDRATHATEDMFFRLLRKGGWFFLGHAEAVRHHRKRWSRHIFPGTPIYQKPDDDNPQHNHLFMQRMTRQNTGLSRLLSESRRSIPARSEFVEDDTVPVTPVQNTNHQVSYVEALTAYHAEQFTEAARLLETFLQVHPQNAKAHTLLAAALAGRHDFKTALAHLETALMREPLLADAHYVQALIYGEQEERAAQEKALRAALYCDRAHVLATYVLGNLQRQTGNLRESERLLQRTRQLLKDIAPDAFLADVSEMRAGRLLALMDMLETG